jgi:L-alanine-DL-glutamate epimerase-like enolase superfamily enzyme
MKIKEIRVFVVSNDLSGKVWNPKIRWRVKHSVLVEVATEEGLTGLGECWCFDLAPDALAAFIASEVRPRILGADALDPEAIARRLNDTTTLSARHGIMASALSGIDIALWDIAARAKGVPLWRLLGGKAPQVPVYASGGLYGENKTVDDLAAELTGYIAQGFDHVKMKVGALPAAEDEARVRAVRRALGQGPKLTIDGVYSFDAAAAQAFHARVADCGIAAFQAPLPAEDLDGMAALVAAGVPITALEAEYQMPVIRALIERPAVAILQFALVACGGISAGRHIAAMAAEADVPCSLEVSSTAVAQMAAFHFAAAHPQVASVEVHMVHRMLFEHFPFPPEAIRDGRLTLPDRPGLGIELPPGQCRQLA